jgi:hypothetical protein
LTILKSVDAAHVNLHVQRTPVPVLFVEKLFVLMTIATVTAVELNRAIHFQTRMAPQRKSVLVNVTVGMTHHTETTPEATERLCAGTLPTTGTGGPIGNNHALESL